MKLKLNPWPIGLILWFAFLIIVCVVFVIKSLGMNHDLVSSDYYAQALNHDQHQAALARAHNLENPPRVEIDEANSRLIIHLPPTVKGGLLNLYRPSDAGMDLHDIPLQEGVPSVLSTEAIYPGRWQAKITWQDQGLDYYFQEDLFIP
ncbi:FixH family protein [Kiritimatiellota bacterium B12222]|nr:FixH family protein [Kiritimatiellota bacterium B12222]